MTRLCLTASDAGNARADACDHLGPWSVRESDRLVWRPARRPFDGRLAEAVRFAHAAGDWLAAEWAVRLNGRHGRQHPPGYWAILLRAWLTTLVDLSFDKYLRLRERRGEPRYVRVWPASAGFPVADTRDFLIGSENEPLNRFVMSRLATGLADAAWTLEEGGALEPPAKARAIRRKERVLEARRWMAIATAIGRAQFYNVPGLGTLDAALLSAATLRRARIPLATDPVANLPAAGPARAAAVVAFAREGFGSDAEGDQLLALLDSMSSELLPANFSTRYESQERDARQRARLTPPWVDTIVCGPSLGGDDEAKFYLAWMRAYRGCRIVVNQHGGIYGLLETYSFVEQTDYRCSDRFLSWGWREQTGCDVDAIPASSPMLGRLTHRPGAQGKVILVTTNVPSYNARIDAAVFADDGATYLQAQLAFAAALEGAAAAHFWLRPYGRTSAVERAVWERHRPGTRILSGALDAELERCRVTVIDHPGTTMCLTIAADIPTVLFWDPEIWRIGAAAQPALEALRGAGILHQSAESAAAHVNRIAPDVGAWWNDPGVRAARETFSQAYCRRNPAWRQEWRALFSRATSPIYAV